MKVFDIFARFGRRSKALSVAVILGFEIQGLGHALGWRLIGSRYSLHPKPETPNLFVFALWTSAVRYSKPEVSVDTMSDFGIRGWKESERV